MGEGPDAEPHDNKPTEPVVFTSGRAAFRYPEFRFYMGARMLVTTATETQSLVIAWQIYSMTHRPLDLGFVGLAQFLPGMLLFLVAGQAADRYPRANILRICCGAFAVCSLALVALTLSGVQRVWPMFTVLFGIGIVRAFNGPASQSFLPSLVPPQVFPTALSWSSSIFQGTQTIAPMLGGLVYGIVKSPVPVYLAAALEALLAIFFITAARPKVPAPVRRAASLETLLDGLRYIKRNRLILGTISLDLFAVLLGGAVALLPVFARDILDIGPMGLGVLRAASSVGAVTMAIVLAYTPIRRKAGAIMLWCVGGFGLFTILFGLSRSLAFSVLFLAITGACDMVSVVIRHTLVLLGTPDDMRGRVSAVNGVFILASNEIGEFESGLTAQWFGARGAILIGGIGTLLIVALWAAAFPSLRRYDRLLGVEDVRAR
jgi:MFS family permease